MTYFPVRITDKKRRRKALFYVFLFLLLPVLSIAGLLLWALGPFPIPGKTCIVAKNTANPNLMVYCTQTFTGTAEPYQVSLWYKKPGDPWKWVYVEHEDTYWWSGSISVAGKGNKFTLLRGGDVVAVADVKKDQYLLRDYMTKLSDRSETIDGTLQNEWRTSKFGLPVTRDVPCDRKIDS